MSERRPRVQQRLFVHSQIHFGAGTAQILFQTENLSESGVLVKATPRLPIGTRAVMRLELPWDLGSIQATGEVVRHTEPTDEGVDGLALRFIELEGDGQERLAKYLRRPS